MIIHNSHDGASALLSEPLLGFVSSNSLELAELSSGVLSVSDSLACTGQNHVEVHSENTSVGVVLDSQVDVLFDTESKVAYNFDKY